MSDAQTSTRPTGSAVQIIHPGKRRTPLRGWVSAEFVAGRIDRLTKHLQRATRVAEHYDRTAPDARTSPVGTRLRATVQDLARELAYWQDVQHRIDADDPGDQPEH